jgi:hypothetical protein
VLKLPTAAASRRKQPSHRNNASSEVKADAHGVAIVASNKARQEQDAHGIAIVVSNKARHDGHGIAIVVPN